MTNEALSKQIMDMRFPKEARPFLKWAGGKSQLLEQFRPLFPKFSGTFHEPFLGGGAVFFELQPYKAVLTDLNEDLINTYVVVRDQTDELLQLLQEHKDKNDKTYYYEIRALRSEQLTEVQRAARLIYLNKTCFNGLYRVNKKGEFNVPFGNYKNPKILDEYNLRVVSKALQGVQVSVAGFETVLNRARPGDFIYFDPPYHPINGTSKFTDYTSTAFGIEEQIKLAEVFGQLARKGIKAMLSNSDTPFIRELYSDFPQVTVQARRAINSKSNGRGPINEVVIFTKKWY